MFLRNLNEEATRKHNTVTSIEAFYILRESLFKVKTESSRLTTPSAQNFEYNLAHTRCKLDYGNELPSLFNKKHISVFAVCL